ncbi:hypothetical protein ABID82_006389 [Methylobacterium sp. PvP062]|jgi:hypothetical protein|uniref:Uncharacterized protein n=2 Tax=Methylobacterium radiotolerans TaxID=31998 RepID=B1M4M6_METRJ|nr:MULTISPECIES: hypothetical protein [Methylobacterium]MCX7331653.1 hypothetical protein [Hyphomicrobiales bacterium]GAN51767.1 hypothetical protein ME121_5859 [Methylobacterium sp. ME121]ACB23485.1 hypothetical protein Mrad2831_1490 [Methylobacterium radiotolerans JCM 2831]KIU36272.1 hypothetical protein SR39_07890 [Methylobacterium radiotolerans]KTS11484.1 hypothetical protein SB3_04385 [Methylobacterium radiotolerans]
MLDRLVTFLPPGAREALRTLAARRPVRRPALRPGTEAAILPGLDTRPAPMAPLHPPAAINDNPLQALHDAVERDLRASGHLR